MQPNVPTRESQLSLASREVIDRICESFELAWRSGERPEIEICLGDATHEMRPALLRELVALELEYRRRAGESPQPEEYAVRFPELVGREPLLPESLVGTQTRTATFRPDDGQSPRVELPVPEKVGRYEIKELLGRGAFGAVYLGWDPQLKRQVAIKSPRIAAENSEEQIAAFLEEARRAVQLERHQGIVPVYDVGREGDACYIVSQYIEGGTLSQFLRKGTPPVETTLRIFTTLADVVHFAHRQGWVHRDIKPSNILLDSAGNPYLADFGLTSRLDEMRSADGPPSGTPNYMAPELAREALAQLRQQAAPTTLRADQRSDIYSLGVVLYQLLTGKLPFEADSLVALFDLVVHSDPVPPRLLVPQIPARLEEVCLKALAKDPADRYRTAADLRDDLNIVAVALKGSQSKVKVDDHSLWGLTPARLAAVVGTGILLCALLAGVVYAIASGWSKQKDLTNPGGETNVAMAGKRAAPPQAVSEKHKSRDRAELLGELRALLKEAESTDRAAGRDTPEARAMFLQEPRVESPPTPTPTPGPPIVRLQTDSKLPPAQAALQRKINRAREEQDTDEEFSLLLKASNDFSENGFVREAELAATRMTELAAKDDAKRPIAFGQLGIAQSKLGRYEDALKSHEQALGEYRAIHATLTTRSKSGDLKAQSFLSHISRMLGLTLNRIGNVNKELRRYDEADKAYLEARDVLAPFADRKSDLLTVLMNYGSLRSLQQEHAKALELLDEALRLAEELNDKTAQAEILTNLGNAQSRAGDDAKAVASYARADELLPVEAPYETRSRLLYNWITSLLALDKFAEAKGPLDHLRQIARPDDPLAQRILKAAQRLEQ